MPKRKWEIHVEAEITLEFEPWEGIDLEAYLHQIGVDVVSVPSYIADGSVRINEIHSWAEDEDGDCTAPVGYLGNVNGLGADPGVL
jgi:hypothetical protein